MNPVDEHVVAASHEKLHQLEESLRPWMTMNPMIVCDRFPLIQAFEYRCRCTFQLVLVVPATDLSWSRSAFRDENPMHSTSTNAVLYTESMNTKQMSYYSYAIRRNRKGVLISTFPIANRRIQRAMRDFVDLLNHDLIRFHAITSHLTSVSFVSSWRDCDAGPNTHNDDGTKIHSSMYQSDHAGLVATLHYDEPIAEPLQWQQQARSICHILHWQQLTGRSRKCILRAFDDGDDSIESQGSHIRDTLWIQQQLYTKKNTNQKESNPLESTKTWTVTLENPDKLDNQDCDRTCMAIDYFRPESAFGHPNASVMCQALAWILQRVTNIVDRSLNCPDPPTAGWNMIELYAGMGAHTIPLAKSNLLQFVTSVELDDRLVKACRINLIQNAIHTVDEDSVAFEEGQTICDHAFSSPFVSTSVKLVAADAALWAYQYCKRINTIRTNGDPARTSSIPRGTPTILLVDPPRQGLDPTVCQMALHVPHIHHLLYISCGKHALQRDLQLLCSPISNNDRNATAGPESSSPYFQVANIALADLFPGTDAVESLIHLIKVVP